MEVEELLEKEPYFQAKTLAAIPNPQQLAWLAMHQDYSEDWIWGRRDRAPDESKAGENVIKNLLGEKGKRGHWGPLEHPQITFSTGFFPHSTMQQARTHRVGISFDTQSFRYTSQQIRDAATGERPVEKVLYIRPEGYYTSRKGDKYYYTDVMRREDCQRASQAAQHYNQRIEQGISEEHARGLIPFDVRQHFVVSFNARSLMHFLDLRHKDDVQLETKALSELLLQEFKEWMPQIADWYCETRLNRAIPAP